jgi:hypothetical protein
MLLQFPIVNSTIGVSIVQDSELTYFPHNISQSKLLATRKHVFPSMNEIRGYLTDRKTWLFAGAKSR